MYLSIEVISYTSYKKHVYFITSLAVSYEIDETSGRNTNKRLVENEYLFKKMHKSKYIILLIMI